MPFRVGPSPRLTSRELNLKGAGRCEEIVGRDVGSQLLNVKTLGA